MASKEERHKLTGRLAGGFIAALVLAGVVLFSIRLLGGDGGDPGATPTATAGRPTSSDGCDLPAGEQAIPATAPDADWYYIGKSAAPKSANIGPAVEKDGVYTCFARSPVGALFAAVTISTETVTGTGVDRAAARARIVPGKALEEALAQPENAEPGVIAEIAGFRIEDYTRDRVNLSLVTRPTTGPNAGALGSTPMTMVWRDGDWWWELTSLDDRTTVISSLDGYIAWGPNT